MKKTKTESQSFFREKKATKDKKSNGKYDPRNKLNNLTSSEWVKETVSVFTQKGLGRGHKDTEIEKQHPAPFSFQDVARLINFFTKKDAKVLDPFSGYFIVK